MSTRYFALIAGILLALMGLLGFVPNLVNTAQPMLAMNIDSGYGLLFGMFPVNVIDNIMYLVVGLWGVVAFRSVVESRAFSRGAAIIFGLIAVFGLLPGLNTMFGLIPFYGHDIWLHAIFSLVSTYFGYVAVVDTVETYENVEHGKTYNANRYDPLNRPL